MIDVVGQREVRRIPVGVVPHDVAASADGSRGYVLSAEGVLVFVDPSTGTVLSRIDLRGRPHDMVVLEDEVRITDIASPFVTVVKTGNRRTRTTVALSAPGHDLALRPGSPELWITLWSGNGIMILNIQTRMLLGTVKVGSSPQHLAFTPDGGEAWITETATGPSMSSTRSGVEPLERSDAMAGRTTWHWMRGGPTWRPLLRVSSWLTSRVGRLPHAWASGWTLTM